MIMLRDLNLHDLRILEDSALFPLPNLTNPLYVVKQSVVSDDKLIASFWVKITSEVSIVFGSEASSLSRARALLEVYHFLLDEMKRQGLDDTHLFVKNPGDFGNILVKHLKFKKVPEESFYRDYNCG